MSRGRAPGPGTLKKRGQQWTLDYTDASGKRVRRALGDNKRVAERRRSELIQRRDMELDGLGAVQGQELLLSEIADEYLADMEPRVSAHHFRNVRGRLLKTVGALGGIRVRELKPMQVIRLRNNAVQAGRSHRTANLIATTLQAMLRWAVESGIVAQSPIEKIKPLPQGPEHRRYRRRALTDDEIRRLLMASQADDERAHILAPRQGHWRIPQTPMWRLLLDTGARWNELRQIAWQDVDLAQGLVVLRAENTKSRKQRVIPLAEETLDVLRGLKVLQQQVLRRIPRAFDRVFISPEGSDWGRYTTNPMRILDRVLRRAKIQKQAVDGTKLDIHALRHTFATRLARSGAPLMHAQRLLGHSDPKLTAQIYTHLDVEDLRGAIEGMAGTHERARDPGEGVAGLQCRDVRLWSRTPADQPPWSMEQPEGTWTRSNRSIMPRQPEDIVSKETRSRMMRSVRRKGTAPELAVRQFLRGLGVRYRLNHPGLPGRPDIANRSRGWAIFVHGCFWHGHRNCRVLKSGKRERVPARNADFWGPKLEANRKRDARKSRELEAIGIDVLVIWECELRHVDAVRETVRVFLETKGVMPSP